MIPRRAHGLRAHNASRADGAAQPAVTPRSRVGSDGASRPRTLQGVAMDPLHDDLLAAFEAHSPERIAALLTRGLDPLAPIAGSSPVDALVEMYFRSDRFPACLRLLLDRGAVLADPALAPVLLDDPDALTRPCARTRACCVARRRCAAPSRRWRALRCCTSRRSTGTCESRAA
jgi:hypothetical protein